MIILTGAAGFIGSCLLRILNDIGMEDIIVVDDVHTSEKWMNLRNKKYTTYIHRDAFLNQLRGGCWRSITHIIHMGACSATTELDFDYLYTNNFEYTKALWKYAVEHQISFIYASSAATYGNGSQGFDDQMDISSLLPLNRYGYSKQLFDLWVKRQVEYPKQYVGLKFFNVYGPNEYAKGSMASVIYHGYKQVVESGTIRLFKSYKEGYEDGGQLRDFVYVKDICTVILYLMNNPSISGLFNVGTGKAESFHTLAESVFNAMGKQPNITYIDMPETLRDKYQYFTQASIEKLRDAGYTEPFSDLHKGVEDYVKNYLMNDFLVY